ncbi:MAG: hypothetical protein WCV69_01155 [Patescibacteria group bacterium]|jgi:hypothetical protein
MTTNEQLKKKYSDRFNFVKKLVLGNDPIGLTDGGAPDDEYDSLINGILSEMEKDKDGSGVRSSVFRVLSSLGPVDEERCEYIAVKILEEYYKS